ncbi:hypothetical protein BDW69DRAFT_197100 [Aspergillus filifer]
MIAKPSYLLSALFLALDLVPMASAQCETPDLPPGMTLGTSGPAHPATLGFWINHVGLTCLCPGRKKGTGYQTASELLRDKNNSGGLVKLLHFADSDADPVSPFVKTTTLVNLGLVVPNLEEAQKWFEKNEVTIVKPRGVASLMGDSEAAISFDVGVEATTNTTEVEAIVKGLKTTGFEDLIFI